MTATFYTFSKKENSTKRPAAGSGTAYGIYLKDATGILSPQIEIHYSGAGDPAAFNYAYIGDFERYYFVREWTYNKGIWTAQLEVDALASWKDYISAANAYVLRSANTANWNKSIVDGKYPTLGPTKHSVANIGAYGPWDGMSYVIGTMGDATNTGVSTFGGINYYVVSPIEAGAIFDWLVGPGIDHTSYTTVLNSLYNNFADDLFLATFDPMQYISTVKFFPIGVGGLLSAQKFAIGKVSYAMDNLHTFIWPVRTLGPYSFTIPKHPQITARGDYLSSSPYSDYVFELQPYGRIELDGSLLAKADTLSFAIQLDMISGDSLIYLSASGPNEYTANMGVYPGRVGTEIQIAQVTSNIFHTAVSESLRAAAAAASDNWFGVADAAISAGTDVKFKGTTSGAQGSYLVADVSGAIPLLHLYYKEVTSEDKTHFGVPICENLVLGALSGYIICAEGDIDLPSTQQERETIAGYLTGGFFYE